MDRRSLYAQFAEYATDVEGWFFMAVDLLESAKLLEPEIKEYWRIEHERTHRRQITGKLLVFPYQPDLRGIYFMLIAFAIENLTKGLLIKKSSRTILSTTSQGGRLPKSVLHHNLRKLLEGIGFHLDHNDKELAFRLERSAVWSARYPVPPEANHKTLSMPTAEGEETVPSWHKEDDVEVVKNFVARVEGFVDQQLEEMSKVEVKHYPS